PARTDRHHGAARAPPGAAAKIQCPSSDDIRRYWPRAGVDRALRGHGIPGGTTHARDRPAFGIGGYAWFDHEPGLEPSRALDAAGDRVRRSRIAVPQPLHPRPAL